MALQIPTLPRYAIVQANKECTLFIYSQGHAWRLFKYRRSGMHLSIQRAAGAGLLQNGSMWFCVCLQSHSRFPSEVTCKV